MPRFTQLAAHVEEARLRERFEGARVALVTTQFAVHERNDRHGRECPCCGHTDAWNLGTFDDLAVQIDLADGTRRNRWELSANGQEAFDDLAASAAPWGTPGADIWHAPIVYRCSEDAVAQICDDVSETIYWSGGWRSSKTHRMCSWWSRGWVKYGGMGETFWLLAPGLARAFKLMLKIFVGKSSNPAVLPLHDGRPMLVAGDLPVAHTATHLNHRMIDGSIVELYHAGRGGGANLEGDDVRRAALDEAARVRGGDAYQVLRGRVAQNLGKGGAVGMASVPDDEGAWLYDDVVQPFEQHGHRPDYHHTKVYTVSAFDNIWIPMETIQRMSDGTTDPKVKAEKIEGQWTRRGLYAYGDVWIEDEFARDIASHEPAAWGFTHDVTSQVCRPLWGLKPTDRVPYVGAVDSNWDPQTALLGRVFGDPNDPSTWTLVFLAEQIIEGDSRTAAEELAAKDGGRYRESCLVPDGTMFHDSHFHGTRAKNSNDAAEYKRAGFRVRPPMRAKGEEYSPPVLESRGVVREMMRQRRTFVSTIGAPSLAHAITKVPSRPKRQSDSNTYLDKRIYNCDDCLRYLEWRLFSKRVLPRAKGMQIHSGGTIARTQ